MEGLIVYTLLKFRADKQTSEPSPPAEAPVVDQTDRNFAGIDIHPAHHGNTRLEIGYTAFTAAVFIMLVVVSWSTLFSIETPPPGDSMTVEVTGSQWAWSFHYPAENITEATSFSEMHVPVNMIVRLNVTSRDVAHAVWIPDLGVKIDAYPGRQNHFWFKAEREGRFLLECAEFCGGSHSEMHAAVIAEPQATYDAWVASKRAALHPPPPPLSNGTLVNITLAEYTVTTSQPLNINLGATILLNITNAGTMAHAFFLGAPYNWSSPTLNATESFATSVVFNQSVQGGDFYCPLDGHRQLGMNGTFNVSQSARTIDVYMLEVAGPHGIWSISPESVIVQQGEVINFRVHNNGTTSHNLMVGPPYNVESPLVAPGASDLTPAITVTQSGQYWCNVPGHKGLGMLGDLDAGGGAPPPPPPADNVPGFEYTSVFPALSVAAVAVLWHRSRRPSS